MSGSSEEPWSDNPSAPRIPYSLYFAEKANFAGIFISTMLYGIIVILFFQCMSVLLSSAYRRRRGGRWGLVAYATTSFAFLTIFTAINNLYVQSDSYIDNREFSGTDELPPGPLGYQYLTFTSPVVVVANFMFFLNNWLADSLLLYRCYIFYNKKFWVIAFPCALYIASLTTGIMLICLILKPDSDVWGGAAVRSGLPYFSISLSLNILLTLLIVARLAMHERYIRNALGTRSESSGLYETIITVLVESCAIYAVTSLLFVVPWGAKSHVADIFLPILAQVQVIAPLLIIRRLADQSALEGDTMVLGSGIRFKHEGGSTSGSGTLLGDCPTIAMGRYGKASKDKTGGGVEVTLEIRHDEI